MGLDDDADCVEHAWQLDEVLLSRRGGQTSSRCARCGAVVFEPGQAAERDRPPL